MKKGAGKNKESTDTLSEELQIASQMLDARQYFVAEVLGLSWRLAFAVLVPLIGGIQLDKRFNSEPAFTSLGLILAFGFGCVAVWTTVKKVNEMQSIDTYKNNKEK